MVPATSASFAKLYAEHPDATIIGGATDVGCGHKTAPQAGENDLDWWRGWL